METATTSAPTTQAPANDVPNFVSITAKAVEMVLAAIEQEGLTGHGIRIGVAGGGCSGFSYSLGFDKSFALPEVRYGIHPPYPPVVLEETAEFVIHRDERGITKRDRRDTEQLRDWGTRWSASFDEPGRDP